MVFTIFDDLKASTDWSAEGTSIPETVGALDMIRHDMIHQLLKHSHGGE